MIRFGADRPTSGQYRRLLTQGTLYGSALQLSNVSAVLPIVCVKWGSLWVAGLLYPAFNLGIIAGFAASTVVLGRSRHRKHLVFASGCASMGVLILCAAISAQHCLFINTVFLVTSVGLGTAKGICDGTHRELVSAKLPLRQRSRMILTEYAVSAVIIVAATFLVIPALPGHGVSDGDGDLTVLWLGAVGMAAAAIAAIFVGPVHGHASAAIPRLADTVRRGMDVAKAQPWFRQYAATQLMFVPITSGATFYALHMPVGCVDGNGSLSGVVVCSTAGLLIGSYLWRAVHRVAGVRGMLIGSALTAVSAAGVCMLSHEAGLWSQGWVHGLIFVLVAAADQAVYAASIEWIGMFAEECDRPILVGFTMAAAAVAAALVGVVLGAIAQRTSATWPALVVLALNGVAVASALHAGPRHMSNGFRRRRNDCMFKPSSVLMRRTVTAQIPVLTTHSKRWPHTR